MLRGRSDQTRETGEFTGSTMFAETTSTTFRVALSLTGTGLAFLAMLSVAGCNVPGVARVPPLPESVAQQDGVASLETVTLNGSTQHIQIRAHNPDAPLLLYLAGGPGGSEMAWLRHYHPELERHFVVIHWDQRGAAKSYAAADWNDISPQQYLEDAGELISQLLYRFQRQCLLVVGNSWGSILGVRVAARWPEQLCGYVGVTQQVNVIETDQLGWQRTLARARQSRANNDIKTLEELGEPPYFGDDFAKKSTKLIRLQDRYGGTALSRSAGSDQVRVALLASEYSWWDRLNFFRGLYKAWKLVYPQLATLDLETEVPELEVPVWLLLSHDDITVPPEPAVRWLNALKAPQKKIIWFDNAGHTLTIDAAKRFDDVLINQVLPAISTKAQRSTSHRFSTSNFNTPIAEETSS